MNKRMKKKRKAEKRVRALEAYARVVHYSLGGFGEALKSLVKRVEELEGRVNINVQATNNRFNQLEAENKVLHVDLDKAIIEFKKPKRSLFGRK